MRGEGEHLAGSTTFTYAASDSSLTSDAATVTINVSEGADTFDWGQTSANATVSLPAGLATSLKNVRQMLTGWTTWSPARATTGSSVTDFSKAREISRNAQAKANGCGPGNHPLEDALIKLV